MKISHDKVALSDNYRYVLLGMSNNLEIWTGVGRLFHIMWQYLRPVLSICFNSFVNFSEILCFNQFIQLIHHFLGHYDRLYLTVSLARSSTASWGCMLFNLSTTSVCGAPRKLWTWWDLFFLVEWQNWSMKINRFV